ncbi:MAG: SPOR domain-containing protein [Janthinobacterium lividum]
MALFPFSRKTKQEPDAPESGFQSRAEGDSEAVRSRGKRAPGKRTRGADPVLPEKKRARRRLVGAVALVLAAIVGLPMILDAEQKPLANDIAIDIPSKDKRTQGKVKEAVTPPADTAAPAGTAASGAGAAGAGAANGNADGGAAKSANIVAGLDKDGELMETPAAPGAKAPAAVDEAPVRQKQEARAEPKADNERKEEMAQHKQDAERKREAERKLAERSEAAREASRARALLEGGTERKPVEKTADKSEVKTPGKFIVQVAALATQEKIDELQGKLKGAGIKSYTQKVVTESGTRTRIRVGPYASKDEAEKARARLIKLGLNGTLVPG